MLLTTVKARRWLDVRKARCHRRDRVPRSELSECRADPIEHIRPSPWHSRKCLCDFARRKRMNCHEGEVSSDTIATARHRADQDFFPRARADIKESKPSRGDFLRPYRISRHGIRNPTKALDRHWISEIMPHEIPFARRFAKNRPAHDVPLFVFVYGVFKSPQHIHLQRQSPAVLEHRSIAPVRAFGRVCRPLRRMDFRHGRDAR